MVPLKLSLFVGAKIQKAQKGKKILGEREGGGREGERERENSKTVILKGGSVRSIWTCLTASPCYVTSTNKHNQRERHTYREKDRQTDRHIDRQTNRGRDTERESTRSIT